jgi:hypothetical protein
MTAVHHPKGYAQTAARDLGRPRSPGLLNIRAPVAKWLPLRTANPAFAGSNPARRSAIHSTHRHLVRRTA